MASRSIEPQCMALCLRCKNKLTVSVIWSRASFGGGASLGGRGRVNQLQGDSVCGSGSVHTLLGRRYRSNDLVLHIATILNVQHLHHHVLRRIRHYICGGHLCYLRCCWRLCSSELYQDHSVLMKMILHFLFTYITIK